MATSAMLPRRFHESELAGVPKDEAAKEAAEQRQKGLVLTDYHARPSFGTSGQPITVLANFFQVRFAGRGKQIYHYDVDIKPILFRPRPEQKDDRGPPKLPLLLTRKIIDKCAEEAPELAEALRQGAFDGRKNLFTPEKFPMAESESKTIRIFIADEEPRPPRPGQEDTGPSGRRFDVTLKYASVIDLESVIEFCRGKKQATQVEEMMLTAIMSINVLLRQDPMTKFTPIGAAQNRWFTMQDVEIIGQGGLVAKGFMQSFRPALGYPGIQLDTAYSAFLQPGPLTQVAARILSGGGGGGGRGGRGGGRGGRGGFRGGGYGGGGGHQAAPEMPQSLNSFQISTLRKIFSQCKFTITHRPSSRVFTIMSITAKPANEIEFLLAGRDGGPDVMTNLAAYFHNVYGRELRYPRLPCVVYGKKNYVPLEFVKLEPFNGLPPNKLTPEQAADMIKVAAQRPGDRRDRIMHWRSELSWERLPKVKDWGLEVNTNLTEVQARVLAPPTVMYAGNGGKSQPRNGSWNLLGKQFFKPGAPLKAWSVVSFDRNADTQLMQGFITYLVNNLKRNGMSVPTERPPLLGPINPAQGTTGSSGVSEGVYNALLNAGSAAYAAGGKTIAPQLIIVILPGRDPLLYEEVKRCAAANLKAPVPTQCLLASKLQGGKLDQYTNNVSMKIHSKLGGVTHSVPLQDLPGLTNRTMLVGADVSHPPNRGDNVISPSIAATIATKNNENNLYQATVREQEGRQEIISDLQNMMEGHLKEYGRNTKYLPDSIVFYRDGVSEGQYAVVVQQECKAIRMACEALRAGYKPKLTFVICAKKHNMRFFARTPADCDRSGNLPPGTVVDRTVVHPFAFDFYLQAQAGLVGTARPTHYVVLVDENNFGPDNLQRLTNGLCYSFARATRSVSIVSVCYYADIICTKARALVYDEESFSDTQTVSSATSGPRGPVMKEFDPLRIAKLFAKNPAFENVAWYM
ncbi:hypothetical protein QFC22_001670 [Naganishia vaughanmartiniae]|uniref:Uncharacterized protein n=1 Tax=Naganishia vaughanmartiniae TaxID=1424756 RepID=A0ACC2XFT9_9TREE|nr:hypothetical protein QFC22_001670 [Naganishia vaughanmartiniae]